MVWTDGPLEPDDPPELPEGWWDDDQAKNVADAIKALDAENFTDHPEYKARLAILKYHANIIEYVDPEYIKAKEVLGLP